MNKSGNYPTTVPKAYARGLKRDAYRTGWNNAHGIACHNVPTIGERVWTEGEGRQIVTADNVRDIHASLCHEAEQNGRQFSPFEFLASDINKRANADQLWEAYDAGVGDSIAADIATYTDEDYPRS